MNNEIIHRGLSFKRHLLVRLSFSFTFHLKVMSIDTTLHFKFHKHVFWNDLSKKKQRNDYFLHTLIIQRPTLVLICQRITFSLSQTTY